MGIVDIVENEIFIIHSNSYNGVCIETLDSFKVRNGKPTDSIYVYRIDADLDLSFYEILNRAYEVIGEPYNNTYILSDTGYYCSEFIYHIFESQQIFTLNPMTFKNPGSNEFNDTWEDYYFELGIEIPEGLPGCNPNGMANNDNLKFVTKI